MQKPSIRTTPGLRRFAVAAAILTTGMAAATLPSAFVSRSSSTGQASAPEPWLRLGPRSLTGTDVAVASPASTSASDLRAHVDAMETRLRDRPGDLAAIVSLADGLLRLSRVSNDARPAGRVVDLLTTALTGAPGSSEILRRLGTAYLSLHRFREALDAGQRARDVRPDDSWSHGVIGDAFLELGEYDEAFAAFEAMMTRRPSAAAYARVAYARELTGDLAGAVEAMRVALEAAPPQDVEAQAWYASQMGELLLQLRRVDEAHRYFELAVSRYPEYPVAMVGIGKVREARGDPDSALAIYLAQLSRSPTLEVAARIGDLHASAERHADAERYFQLAEDLAGPAAVQTEATLALFLAERERKPDVAVRIAESVAKTRRDIGTDHALAWAYFKAGRIREASVAIARAQRTGSRDERLRVHAAAIQSATDAEN